MLATLTVELRWVEWLWGGSLYSSTLQDLAYCGAWERESLRDPMPVPRYFEQQVTEIFKLKGGCKYGALYGNKVLGQEGWAVSRRGSRLWTTIWSAENHAEKYIWEINIHIFQYNNVGFGSWYLCCSWTFSVYNGKWCILLVWFLMSRPCVKSIVKKSD